MSKKPWEFDKLTGVRKEWIPDEYQDAVGNFSPTAFPDCNVFGKAVAGAAGFSRVDKFNDAVVTGTGSYWHLHPVSGTVKNNEEKLRLLFYCTHTDSAAAGGESYKKAAKARMLAGKKPTDVSGGSGA